MNSILGILQDIRNLPKVPCYIKIIPYYETIKGIKVEKMVIFNSRYRKEVEKAMNYEYCEHCVVLYKKQYDALFKPLFEDLGLVNKAITILQQKLDEE